MAVRRPMPSQLVAIAQDLGMTLTDAQATDMLGMMSGALDAYDEVDAMPDIFPRSGIPAPRAIGRRATRIATTPGT